MRIFSFLSVLLCLSLLTHAQKKIGFHEGTKKTFLVDGVVQNSFTAAFHLSELSVNPFTANQEEFLSLTADGFGRTYETGQPDLPIYNQLIVVPKDVILSIAVINTDEEEIDMSDSKNNRLLKPAIASISKSQKNPEKIKYEKGKAYKQNSFNDRPAVELHEVGIMRDVKLYELVYRPVLYNAVANKIRVRHQVQVKLAWEGQFPSYMDWDFTDIDTHTSLVTSAKSSLDQETYVIVSPTKYKETLQSFVNWKRQQGFYVIEAYIGESISSPDKNVIKTYLKNLYDNPASGTAKPSYILLVGDVADIPAWNGETDSHATDLYYAEYTGDFLPEVFYGRFSAVTTTQLNIIITKTLYVEQGSGNLRGYHSEHLLVSGVDASYAPTYGNGAINYFMDYYSNEQNGVNAHYYLYGSGSPIVSNSLQAHQAMIDDFDAGVGIAYYSAHCSADGWADPSFSISDISSLSNTNEYPLMIGNCCQSYSYNTTSFAEEIVRTANKGAVAYIGASNFSYWDEDYYWGIGFTSNIVANPTYEATGLGSWDAWFHTHNETDDQHAYTAGQILNVGNLAVQSSTSDLKGYYWEIYGIMGDPSLVPAKYQTQEIEPVFTDILVVGQSNLKVTAPKGATITLMENGKLAAFGKADATDVCDLTFEPLQHIGENQIIITATHPGYAPFIDSLRVIAPNGPFLVMTEILITDLLGNQNNMAEFGETMGAYFQIQNFGNEDAHNVVIELNTDSEWVLPLGENHTIEVGTILANELKVLTSPLQIQLKNNVPDQEAVVFNGNLHFSDSLNSGFDFDFTVNGPDLNESNWLVDQAGVGNANGIVEVNEEVTMTAFFANAGHAPVSNTTISFSSSDEELLTVLSEPVIFGGFDPSQTKSVDVVIKAGADFFAGDQVFLTYQLAAGDGHQYLFEGKIAVTLGDEPDIWMGNGSQEIVTANFYDSGGPDAKYSNNEKDTLTLLPHHSGEGLMIDFAQFEVESSNTGCWDKLKIYDGANTNAPLLGSFCTINFVNSLQSQNESGALTFVFESDDNTTKNGWKAYISSSPKSTVTFSVTNGIDQVADVEISLANRTLLTNEQGLALFMNTLQDGEKTYTISKPGYFSKTGKISSVTGDTTLVILLEKLPEICFTAFENILPLEGVSINFDNQTMVTDANGSALFTGVLPGTKSFRATKTGYVDTTGTIVVGTVNFCYSLHLRLKPTYLVKMVISDEFGLVSGAKVTVGDVEKLTNTEGEITFDGLNQGNYGYTVEKEGYQKVTGGFDITDSDLVKNISISHITYGATFNVTSNSGPVDAAEISVLGDMIATASNGKVSMYGIIPAQDIAYSVSKLGYTTHEGTFDVVNTDVTLNIELTYVDIHQLTNNGLQVYPNPVSKDYRVRVTSVETMDQLQVFSYNGALLINYLEPTKEYLIDFSKFSKGIYILQARVGEQVHYEKVIVE